MSEAKAVARFGQNLQKKLTITLPGGRSVEATAVAVNKTITVRASNEFGNNVGELSGGGTGRMQYEIQPRFPEKPMQMYADSRKIYEGIAPNGMVRVEMTSNPGSVIVYIGGKKIFEANGNCDILFHCEAAAK